MQKIPETLREIFSNEGGARLNCNPKIYREKDGEINREKYSWHLEKFAEKNNLALRDVFKKFVEKEYIKKKNITPKELFFMAYVLSPTGSFQFGIQYLVYALDITQENASQVISETFPDWRHQDRHFRNSILAAEDLIGWPRDTIYPQYKPKK